jgi:hypothetical protein
MSQSPARNFKYYLFSPTNPPFEYVELHDQAFRSWITVVRSAFEEVGNWQTEHLHDDFVRQNVVGCLCSEDEVVATFLHSFSSIYTQATRTFRYMQSNYPELFFQGLQSLGIKNVLSVHYLAVAPQWRKGRGGIQIAPVMMGLAQRIRDQYMLDALIGVYRKDRNVHEIAYSLGGDCVIADVYNHNTLCDLIVMNKNKPYVYPSKEIGDQISFFWETRIDTLRIDRDLPRMVA